MSSVSESLAGFYVKMFDSSGDILFWQKFPSRAEAFQYVKDSIFPMFEVGDTIESYYFDGTKKKEVAP